jgi:hypothetical protein
MVLEIYQLLKLVGIIWLPTRTENIVTSTIDIRELGVSRRDFAKALLDYIVKHPELDQTGREQVLNKLIEEEKDIIAKWNRSNRWDRSARDEVVSALEFLLAIAK